MNRLNATMPAVRALRTLIAALAAGLIPRQISPELVALPSTRVLTNAATTASEWLALSYQHQAAHELEKALDAARAAVRRSPNFGFGLARVAELEFSFGRRGRAQAALDRALTLSPRHAQAHALRGFLLTGADRVGDGLAAFEKAIALDSGLANAWLGRGLCQFRMGRTEEGLEDLRTAAVLEPARSLLHSYLGKGFDERGAARQALHELEFAKKLDPADPTPWLYSALLHREQNRINDSVDDLERSLELNDNRRLYRSRFLLDQDRAVRSANLASIYRDAGAIDVSTREAARAVNADYANFSAHLFLASSYFDLLNYTPQVNLRYETPRVSEYLVATLLAPVSAGVLSPTVSQQEYSRLFERDDYGFTSSTEYLSRGAWKESVAQFGTHGKFGYSLDAYYQWDPGQRANNDLELTSLAARVKQQLTSQDALFLQLSFSDARFGDLAQYYNPFHRTNGANRLVRSKETQEPLLLAGYHHEWSPASHTLALAGRLQDTLRVDNPSQGTLVLARDETNGPVVGALPYAVMQDYRSELEIYTAEAQQIFQCERCALILGGRYQSGQFETRNTNTIFPYVNAAGEILEPAWFVNPLQKTQSHFERLSAYGYTHWEIVQPLRLIGGVAYDRLTYPGNFRFAPVSDKENSTEQVSPKAGLILGPLKDFVLRAAYSRALGGASIDQSFQLEPSQVAGFNQAWRSIIPESVTGANAAERFESRGASLEYRFPTRTYAGIGGEWLNSKVNRVVGVFNAGPPDLSVFPTPPFIFQSGTRERLDFEERTLTATLNQLVGDEWSFGARYRLSEAEMDERFPEIPASAIPYGGFRRRQHLEATLHQMNLFAIFNHPSGLFAQLDSLWSAQSNRGYAPDIPGDDFWQFNGYIGYRFPRRQAEIRVGVLNFTDQDYRLNPLNLTSELPRERTLLASLRFWF